MTSRAEIITSHPYAVQVFQGEIDISQAAGVRSIQYHADGRATQTRLDGSQQAGRWELLEGETLIRMTMEQSGVSEWAIIELDGGVFRKRDTARGLVAVQTPMVPAVAAS